MGCIYDELGDTKLALEYMKKANDIDKNHFRILFNMGVFNKKLGNLELAEEYYKKSIEQNPYYPYSYLNYAVMYREKEDFKRAIKNFHWIDTVLGAEEKTVLECEERIFIL